MLSVSNVSNSAQGMSYYASDNYYSKEEGLENSSWQGAGAEALGLTGKVDKESFEQLLKGEVDGQQLGKMEKDENGENKINHLPAIDVTFSAPKSVSIMAEVYGDERIKEAHQEAVTEVLDTLSNESINTRVMKNGVMTQEKSNQVVIAKFDHDTNRNQDPNTHTHTLILNVVKAEDGKWKSIDNREIYDSQRMYGAMYTNKLAEKIQKLGYDIEVKDDKGNFEIKGVGEKAVVEFSSRKNQIDDKLEEMGTSREAATAAQREAATLSTRDKKIDLAHDELKGKWESVAKNVMEKDGYELINNSKEREIIDNTRYSEDKGAKKSATYAMKVLTEREAVVDNKELRQKAYERGVGTTSTKAIDRHLGELEKSGVISPVGENEKTTKAVLKSEKWTINTVTDEKETIEKIVTEDQIVDQIIAFEEKKGFKLKEGQVGAVKDIFTTQDRFIAIQGLAGTGKTTMLEVVKKIADEEGVTVRGMSGTKKAANTLMEESGIKSDTTAMFVIKSKGVEKEWQERLAADPKAIREKEIWIVDESSFAGQKDLNTIAKMAVDADARVVFVGDKLQLQSINFGKPFEAAQEKGMQTSLMTDINRQETDQLKTLVNTTLGDTKNTLETKNIEQAFNYMQEQGLVIEIAQPKEDEEKFNVLESGGDKQKTESLIALATKYVDMSAEEREKTKIITPFNKDRVAANSLIREGLKEKGELGADDVYMKVYKNTGKTSIEMNEAWNYKEGDVVVFSTDVRHLDIEKNEAFKVIGLNDDRSLVKLEHEDGRELDWKPAKRHRAIVYKEEGINLTEGDQVKFTKNDPEQRYTNNMEGVVVSADKYGVKIQTEDGNRITLGEDDKYIDHNYASTVYGAQGSTYKNSYLYVNVGDDLNENDKKSLSNVVGDRMFYVAATRAKENFAIYTPNASAVREVILLKQDKRYATGDIEKHEEKIQSDLDRDANKSVDIALRQEEAKNSNKQSSRENIIKNSNNINNKVINNADLNQNSKNGIDKGVNVNVQNESTKTLTIDINSDISFKNIVEKDKSVGNNITSKANDSIEFNEDLNNVLEKANKEREMSIDDQLQH